MIKNKRTAALVKAAVFTCILFLSAQSGWGKFIEEFDFDRSQSAGTVHPARDYQPAKVLKPFKAGQPKNSYQPPKKVSTKTAANQDHTKPAIIARDGHYVKYQNSIVFDQNTGLEWIAGPDRDMTFSEAQFWSKNLKVDGGGWRLPSIYQLRKLYKKRTGKTNRTHLFDNNRMVVWSKEYVSSYYSKCFNFRNKTAVGGPQGPFSSGVFAVRTRK